METIKTKTMRQMKIMDLLCSPNLSLSLSLIRLLAGYFILRKLKNLKKPFTWNWNETEISGDKNEQQTGKMWLESNVFLFVPKRIESSGIGGKFCQGKVKQEKTNHFQPNIFFLIRFFVQPKSIVIGLNFKKKLFY